jgi:hypothetical protein
MKIEMMSIKVDVKPLRAALSAHPELWNENRQRTADLRSPHRELDDIWIRFAPLDRLGEEGPCVWYPSADALDAKPMIQRIAADLGARELGGVLITRIPAGATCHPHADDGWHARKFEKFGVSVDAAAGQKFCFEGEELETASGDVWRFENQHTHWVTNPTASDRVTLIVCIRR